jgi:hypothetical protein
MPFHIRKFKTGWRVYDDMGKSFSKKPLSKKNATAQLRALYANVPEARLFRGSGYCCMDKDLYLDGDGFFSDVFNKAKSAVKGVVNRITGVSKGIRQGFQPKARSILEKYGDYIITNIFIRRKPIFAILDKVLNFLSLGKWSEAKAKYGYDSLFHLSMVFCVRPPDKPSGSGGAVYIKVEKNEVPDVEVYNYRQVIEQPYIQFGVPCCMTLNQVMNNAQNFMGPKFYTYDAFQNNCQVFIQSILKASGLLTERLNEFIMQDTEGILKQLPSYIQPISRKITDIAGLANVALEGQGKVITMTTQDYIDEHRKLVALLNDTSSKLKREADEQTAEAKGKTGVNVAGKGKPKKWVQKVVEDMKKGAFTKQALRHRMTPEEFAMEVLKNPKDYTLTTRRRAQFLENMSKRPLKGGVVSLYNNMFGRGDSEDELAEIFSNSATMEDKEEKPSGRENTMMRRIEPEKEAGKKRKRSPSPEKKEEANKKAKPVRGKGNTSSKKKKSPFTEPSASAQDMFEVINPYDISQEPDEVEMKPVSVRRMTIERDKPLRASKDMEASPRKSFARQSSKKYGKITIAQPISKGKTTLAKAIPAVSKIAKSARNLIARAKNTLPKTEKPKSGCVQSIKKMFGKGISNKFNSQLTKEGIDAKVYLRKARAAAKKAGYDGRAVEFSDDNKHKLMIYDDKGTPVRFGAVSNKDFIIYSAKDKANADKKRKAYLARATKIKGDWKDNKFSPNNLAISILW